MKDQNPFLFFIIETIVVSLCGILLIYFLVVEKKKEEDGTNSGMKSSIENSPQEFLLKSDEQLKAEAIANGVDVQDLANKKVLKKTIDQKAAMTNSANDSANFLTNNVVPQMQKSVDNAKLETTATSEKIKTSVDNFISDVKILDQKEASYQNDPNLSSEFQKLSSAQKMTANMIKNISNTISQLQEEIESKNSLLIGFATDIQTSTTLIQKTNDSIEQENVQLANESRRLVKDLTSNASTMKTLTDIQAQMTTISSEKNSLSQQIQDLKQMKDELQTKLNLQEAEKTANAKKITLQQALIDQATANLKDLQSRLNTLIKNQSNSASDLEQTIGTGGTLQEKLLAVAQDLSATQALRDGVKSQISDLEEIVANLKSTEQSVKQHLSETQTRISNLEATQTSLQKNLDSIQSQLTQQQLLESEAIKDAASAQQQQDLLQKELNSVQTETATLKNDVDGLVAQKTIVENQLAAKRIEIAKVTAAALATEKQVSQAQNTLDALSQKLADQTSTLDQKTSDMASAATRLSSVQNMQKTVAQQQSALSDQITLLKKERDELEGKISEVAKSVSGKANELSQMETKLATLTSQVTTGAAKVSALQKTQHTLTLAVADRQALLTNIQTQKTQLDSEKASLDQSTALLQKEISDLQNQLTVVSGPMTQELQTQQQIVNGMVTRLGVMQNSLQSAESAVSSAVAAEKSAQSVVQALQGEITAAIAQQNQVSAVAQTLQNNLETVVQGDWGMHAYTFNNGGADGNVVSVDSDLISANYKTLTDVVTGGCSVTRYGSENVCFGVESNDNNTCVVSADQPLILPDNGKIVMCVSWNLNGYSGGAVTLDRVVAIGSDLGATVSLSLPFQGPRKSGNNVVPGQNVGIFITSSLDPNNSNWMCVTRTAAVAGISPQTATLTTDPAFYSSSSMLQIGRGSFSTATTSSAFGSFPTQNNTPQDVEITVCGGVLNVKMGNQRVNNIGNIEPTGILFCGLFVCLAQPMTSGNVLQTTLTFDAVKVVPTQQCAMFDSTQSLQIASTFSSTYSFIYPQQPTSGSRVVFGESSTPSKFVFQKQADGGYVLLVGGLNLSVVNSSLCLVADRFEWFIQPVVNSTQKQFYLQPFLDRKSYLGMSNLTPTPTAWTII